jgi:hypothetical protein
MKTWNNTVRVSTVIERPIMASITESHREVVLSDNIPLPPYSPLP